MKNIKKHYAVACLAALVGGSVGIAAQAGTSRSLGGHSMVNARNYSASRNLGSHNLGGSTHSFDKGKIADFITANGGTVTKSKGDGKASFSVVTGDGATFSGNATKTANLKGLTLTYGTSANTFNGKTYTGSGKTQITNNRTSIGISSAHSGSGSANVSGSSTGTLTKEAQTLNRTMSVGGDSTYNSTLAIQNSTSGTSVNHHETGSINMQGVPLKQTDTTTIVTATPGQQTKFEHIDAMTGWDYVTYFDPVITRE